MRVLEMVLGVFQLLLVLLFSDYFDSLVVCGTTLSWKNKPHLAKQRSMCCYLHLLREVMGTLSLQSCLHG